MKDLKRKVIAASKWSALTEITSKATTPFIFVVLARLLSPEDYGVVAAASIVIGFSQIFSDAGLSATLIQSKEDTNKVANIVFWGNLCIAVIIYTIIFLFSDIIAELFHDIRVVNVLKVQSLILIFNSFSATHSALFKKYLDFKKLFWVRLFTVSTPGLASIPLAYFGYGYWALVAGTLTGSIFQIIILWKLSDWRPTFELELSLIKKIFSFSGWVTLEGILGWFYNWGESFIIGAFLSIKELGLYRAGHAFVFMCFNFFLSPLTPVIFSFFSNIQNDIERVAHNLLHVNKLLAFISLFLALFLFIFSDLLELVVFNNKWIGIAKVIGIIGIVQGFGWYYGANFEAYRAIGKPQINIILMAIPLVYIIPAYIISIKHGLIIFLICRIIISLVTHPLHLFYMRITFNIKLIQWFNNFKILFLMILLSYLQFYLIKLLRTDMIITIMLVLIITIEYLSITLWKEKSMKNILKDGILSIVRK